MNIKYIISTIIFKLINPKRIYNSLISDKSKVSSGCHIYNSEIGKYSYFAYKSRCYNSIIGNYCSIGNNCIIGGAQHPQNYFSTSPVFYDKKNPIKKSFVYFNWDSFKLKTKVGNDVWIGDNVIIKSGVSVGDGSIVGMGSVVTKDIPENQIWAGNPAKFIKLRFEKNFDILNNTKWWNKNLEQFDQDYINSLNDLVSFKENLNEEV